MLQTNFFPASLSLSLAPSPSLSEETVASESENKNTLSTQYPLKVPRGVQTNIHWRLTRRLFIHPFILQQSVQQKTDTKQVFNYVHVGQTRVKIDNFHYRFYLLSLETFNSFL